MKSGFTSRPTLGDNLSTESTHHNSPTYPRPPLDPAFDPKDTARLHIPKASLSTRVFETLPDSYLPSISEELSDEDHALAYLSSAAGFLRRQTGTLDSLEGSLGTERAQLESRESALDAKLDSLEQCQRVYVASTELAKDQLLRSRAMLQTAAQSEARGTVQLNTLKASNRTLAKAKNTLATNADSFEAFYKQFKEEKAAFLEELRQFNKEKEQLTTANQQMQQNQAEVDKKLHLISTRLQEISTIRSDFNSKYTQKKRNLADREASIQAREQDLVRRRSDMEVLWSQYESDWKRREEQMKAREAELQRKIANCDELLGLKEELDRDKEGVRRREQGLLGELRRKEAELERRERQLEDLSEDLAAQRQMLATQAPYSPPGGSTRWEQAEMQREDVLSAGLRLEQFETWLVTREETLHEIDANLNRERLEIDSTARMLESLHHDLELAKSQVAAQRETTQRDQQTLEREKSKVETICRELERQRGELESKEKALESASRRLKERERLVEVAEKGLRRRESPLEAPLAATVDTSRLEELRCKRQELRQSRDKSPEGKWLDTEASRAELRRINQMLQESYLTPRGVMTPISPEISPEQH